MNQPTHIQQPLEFTRGMILAMVVILGVGFLGWIEGDHDPNVMPYVSPVVTRVTEQTVPIPNSYLTVVPGNGWQYLRIENYRTDEPMFINPSSHTVAALAAVPGAVPELSGAPVQYQHVEITWLDLVKEVGGDRLLEGWIEKDAAPARLRILTRAKTFNDDPAIKTLCNAILPAESAE